MRKIALLSVLTLSIPLQAIEIIIKYYPKPLLIHQREKPQKIKGPVMVVRGRKFFVYDDDHNSGNYFNIAIMKEIKNGKVGEELYVKIYKTPKKETIQAGDYMRFLKTADSPEEKQSLFVETMDNIITKLESLMEEYYEKIGNKQKKWETAIEIEGFEPVGITIKKSIYDSTDTEFSFNHKKYGDCTIEVSKELEDDEDQKPVFIIRCFTKKYEKIGPPQKKDIDNQQLESAAFKPGDLYLQEIIEKNKSIQIRDDKIINKYLKILIQLADNYDKKMMEGETEKVEIPKL